MVFAPLQLWQMAGTMMLLLLLLPGAEQGARKSTGGSSLLGWIRELPANWRRYSPQVNKFSPIAGVAHVDDNFFLFNSTGKLVHAELDERALDALQNFPVDGAQTVLQQFLESNLEHVSNKSAFLCGIMKTYR